MNISKQVQTSLYPMYQLTCKCLFSFTTAHSILTFEHYFCRINTSSFTRFPCDLKNDMAFINISARDVVK
ncbi:hypothetical protein EUGRSUZ_E01231 [Eucalyptus grandis]|uniref:Uncharacterized protein n=2 Tax=Eucalyptus grandis TaxID=71139 RepID=A0ACC3KUA1_EUCGR|nr:hypothetical protein EUGRSUZ_E01231 [Eucalyptus grandis]